MNDDMRCTGTGTCGRRDFLKAVGIGAAGIGALRLPLVAGPFDPSDFEKLVPADKKLDPAWVKSLFERGARRACRGQELDWIGMPVGGICAGQLYLGGDGRLWLWDVFNENRHTHWTGPHYREPLRPASPLEQGFAVAVEQAGRTDCRRLGRDGFAATTFYGEYPVGTVEYRDPGLPIEVTLQAFSPFIPLDTADSSLPATIMRFTVRNASDAPAEVALGGWLENAVCSAGGGEGAGMRRNRIARRDGMLLLECDARPIEQPRRAQPRPDILFDDFERSAYETWSAAGAAFGAGPIAVADVPQYQGDVNALGARLVNSHASAPGGSVGEKDSAQGILTSRAFIVERDYINFLIGGGNHPAKTCVNLLVEERAVLSATGHNDNKMQPRTWDVRRWAGASAQLQIVDQESGGWGNIGVDQIVFSDQPQLPSPRLEERGDFGSMGLALLADAPGGAAADAAFAALSMDELPAALFSGGTSDTGAEAARPLDERLIGGLARRFRLGPGESAAATFVIVWHFPNARLDEFKGVVGRHYATRFDSAAGVAAYIAREAERLCGQTLLWRDTWYDSTLPYWFLDRTFANASTLATTTCYRFADGRFYGWEGVGCCAGTCLHVWQYAQAVARLFPELERDTRERVDYGISFNVDSGVIGYRGPEVSMDPAADGQAGTILRTYREHLMSPDDGFLRRAWPRIRKAIEWLTTLDSDRDGVLDRPQYNTLDDAWHGEIAWISSLYVAALRAGAAMAEEMGDADFARQCGELAARGGAAIGARLFNGEYFVHRGDPDHPDSPGSYGGCEIDQVFGQSYAWQVGLGRILEQAKVRSALESLWRYNFTPDIGPYRAAFPKGRWYAVAGDGGLLMCTFPKGDADALEKGHETFASYFNECMTGFEYQVAGHMIWEGMVMEGLAIARMIHDRYHPLRRNPFNEIECGDHYARAMASHGVYLAACGYAYDGPRGELGFAPRLAPEAFRCAFTAAEGWGSFSQETGAGAHRAELAVKWGRLRLSRLRLALADGASPTGAAATVDGQAVPARMSVTEGHAELAFAEPLTLSAGQTLAVALQS